MKRTGLVFVLILLLMASAAEGESYSGAIHFSSENHSSFSIPFQCLMEPDCSVIYTDLFPDYAFEAPLWPVTMNEKAETLFTEWLAMTGEEEVSGPFAGDLFEQASRKKTCSFSAGDIALLVDLLEMKGTDVFGVTASDALLAWIRQNLLKYAQHYPELSFRLDRFEEVQTTALTVLNGLDTVRTFSMRQEDNGSFSFVLGFAEKGKTYYAAIVYGAASDGGSVSCSLWADDQGSGFRSIPPENRIAEATLTLTQMNNFSWTLLGNVGFGPADLLTFPLQGQIVFDSSGAWDLEINAEYGSTNQTLLTIALRADPSGSQTIPENLSRFNLFSANSAEWEEIRSQLPQIVSSIRLALPLELQILLTTLQLLSL